MKRTQRAIGIREMGNSKLTSTALLSTMLVAIVLTVHPLRASADDSCSTVALITNGTADKTDIPHRHEVYASQYYSCALSLDVNTRRAFDLYVAAASEYAAAAHEAEPANPISAFILYVKAYDLYTSTYLTARQRGFGSPDDLKALMQRMAQGARRTSIKALPAM